jgi:hypothetical protein
LTRAYIRLDPDFFERRLERGDPPGAVGAYIAVLCLAEAQPKRGRFRDEAVLRALLTHAFARWLPYLFGHGDLVLEGRRVYIEGWDEWQEGDRTVTERMARVRNRKRNADRNGDAPEVTVEVTAPVTTARLSGGGGARHSGGGGGGKARSGPVTIDEVLRDE